MPRPYSMLRRADAVAETRTRIVAAAVRLHGEQGVRATSWDEIADAAGADRATVYRHFGGLDELVPACARLAFEAIDPPSPEAMREQFAGLDVEGRLRKLIEESCECYERGAAWLRAARREADFVPALAETNARMTEGLARLLDVVLEGRPLDAEARRTLAILCDYPFWQQLIEGGIPTGRAPRVIVRLANQVLAGEEDRP
jgi:AcrR family transcriptional regulator